jgi:tetratricopeptide (TPR) repeat protein
MWNDALENALKAHRNRDYETARLAYETALRRDPASDQAHYLLGMLLLETRFALQALGHFQEALQMKPDQPFYLSALADAFSAMGQPENAIRFYEKSLEPGGSEFQLGVRLNYGATLMDVGRVTDAIHQFALCVQAAPECIPAWNNLGNAKLQIGEKSEAVRIFESALQISPRIPELHSNLSKALLELGQIEKALYHAETAVVIRPNDAAGWMNLGKARLENGQLNEARVAFVKCLGIAPKSASVYANLGTIDELQGQMLDAERHWMKCLELQKDHAGVLGRLATRLGTKLPDELKCRMEAVFEDSSKPDTDRELIGYGLAHYYDKTCDYIQSARYLDQACMIREQSLAKSGRSYDRTRFQLFVEQSAKITRISDSTPIKNEPESDSQAIKMIFIVGMARSGTSLAEQVLASHPEITGAGELTYVPDLYDEFLKRTKLDASVGISMSDNQVASLRKKYLDHISRKGFATKYVVDKLPDNIFYLGLIQRMFPDSMVIITQRNLMDVALSCRMTRFAGVRWNSDWKNLIHRLNLFQSVSKHWLARPDQWAIELHYEQLVQNLGDSIQPVFERIGLEMPVGIELFYQNKRIVNTASAAQVRQPIYASSIGRWKHYEPVYGTYFREINLED